jgi:hypothetical protein
MSVRGAHGEPRFLALNNPARLVLDLPGIRTENRKINGEGAIASMRVGQYKPDTARLALDLIKPMQISGSEHRDGKLLISLSETSAEAFAALTKLRPANLPRVQSGSSGIATTPAQTPSPPSSGSNPDGPAKHTASPVQLAYFQSPSERIVDTGAQDETAGAPRLPLPSGAPLSITAENDPLLNLSKQTESQEVFRAVIATAVARHPSIAEAEANVDRERAERRFPTSNSASPVGKALRAISAMTSIRWSNAHGREGASTRRSSYNRRSWISAPLPRASRRRSTN